MKAPGMCGILSRAGRSLAVAALVLVPLRPVQADHPELVESAAIYGLHDHGGDYLARILPAGSAWVTATSALGADPNNQNGEHFTDYERGLPALTVIGRLNYGYFPDGTIPPRDKWLDFARRCANFVANSTGCRIWVIGNETNLAAEWPLENGRFNYVSPEDYAVLYRLVYNAIKSVRPDHKILPQAIAPWAGPYGAGMFGEWPHDGMPINWVQYKHRMLSAIAATGPIDGIAAHINSRGYSYADIHNPHRINAGGQWLNFSFGVYRDWVDFGIPRSLYHLPVYATESNGTYYWKGGHPEAPGKTYESGWMQEVYAEINRYNQFAAETGRPIYRTVNMYRWCGGCDGWNIDGDNPFRSLILDDLGAAAAENYRWPERSIPTASPPVPSGLTATAETGRVALAWNHVEPVSSYRIYRATDPEGPFRLWVDGLHEASAFDTGFTPGRTYFYRVAARNQGGESGPSPTVSVTPIQGLPDLVVTSLNWDPYDPAEGEPIIFRATVKNQGSAPSPAGVIMGVGFQIVGRGTVTWHGSHTAPIAPGESVQLVADGGVAGNGWVGGPGRYTVVATVNDVNRFAEGDHSNNAGLATFHRQSPRRLAFNSGGNAVELYAADAHFSGSSSPLSTSNSIDVSGATDPAPQAVYNAARIGHFTYAIPGLMPRALYRLRLHFAASKSEWSQGLHVIVNGRMVLENFDIAAEAGSFNRAVIEEIYAPADSEGVMWIEYRPVEGRALSSAIELFLHSIPPRSMATPRVELASGEEPVGIVLTWETEPGRTYRVEFSDDLRSEWADLSGPLVADDDSMHYEPPAALSASGFYRILLLD